MSYKTEGRDGPIKMQFLSAFIRYFGSSAGISNSVTIAFIRRLVKAGAVVAGIAALQSCEAETIGSQMAGDKMLKPPPSLVEETFGRGPKEITLLLAKSRSGYYEGVSRDVRDGAALAIRELDEAAMMQIKVVDLASGGSAAPGVVAAANGRGTGLLVSYLPQATTSAVAAVATDQRPALINLASPVAGAKVFNFEPSELASAVSGLKHTIAGGQKKIVILAPVSLPAADEDNLKAAIGRAGGTTVGVIRYDAGMAADLLASRKTVLDAANAALVMGDGNGVVSVVKALRTTVPSMQLVGTSQWPHGLYSDPSASNAIIATADPDAMRAIGTRYEAASKRPFSIHAALGYDSVAMTIGIARSAGAVDINSEALTSKIGFRGVTGLFRFNANGRVERRLDLYKISGGRLVAVEAGAESF